MIGLGRFLRKGAAGGRFLVSGAVVLGLVLSGGYARAEGESAAGSGIEFGLSPVQLDLYTDFGITLQPGTVYGGQGVPCVKKNGAEGDGCSFTIVNKGEKDFVVSVAVEPYYITDEKYEVSSNQANARTELAKWVKFERTKYSLKSGEKITVPFSVEVPEDVAGGGQYAIIYALAQGEGEGEGVAVGSRWGMPIFSRGEGETRVEAAVKKADIAGFLLTPPITATSVVENTGNVDVVVEHALEVKNLFGKVVYSYSRSGHVMPEAPRKVELAWEDTPSIGIFKVKQEITLPDANGEKQTTVVEQTVVIIPIWFIILAPLLIAGFVIIVVARRKMLKQAQ
jgi:hypothetical protein